MRGPRTFVVLSLFVAVLLASTAGQPAGASGRGRTSGRIQFGKPLDGLTAEEYKLFRDGREAFQEVEDASDGLGPTFNGTSCAACHVSPAIGGATPINETRFAQVVGGVYSDLPGGSLLQSQAISPDCAETVPSGANVVIAQRQTTPLFGSGLIEAIPDSEIVAYGAAQAAFYPGQAGVVNFVTEPQSARRRVGRFGWKAQHATLLAFSGDAYINEMGITNRLFPADNAPNGDMAKLAACDTVRDLENENDIDAFANFMRLLAPPPQDDELHRQRLADFGRLRQDDQHRGDSLPLTRGQGLFERVGCAVCHYAGFTAFSRIRAINGQRVEAYSDFLLHDVATGDGIVQGNAKGNQFRTPPLWGISDSGPYLHDGSAATITDAIRRHGNQGAAARQAFEDLSFRERDALLAFLDAI